MSWKNFTQPGDPWRLGRPLFKYVDVADAHYLEAGSLKIGTLRGYANLESDRRDADENTTIANIDYVSSATAEGRAFFERNLFRLGPNANVQASNSTFIQRGPNLYCLCFSHKGDLPDTDGAQAVFQIDNVKAVINRLILNNSALRKSIIAPVRYGERVINVARADQFVANPLLKPAIFSREHEVRLLGLKEIDDDADPIYGKADPILSKLLRRIR